MAPLQPALGTHRALELHAAPLSARLRNLAPARPTRETRRHRRNSVCHRLPRRHRALDNPKLPRLPRLRSLPRQLRGRTLRGQWTRSLRIPIRRPHWPAGAGPATPALCPPGRTRLHPSARRTRQGRDRLAPRSLRCAHTQALLLLLGQRASSLDETSLWRLPPPDRLLLRQHRRTLGPRALTSPPHARRRAVRVGFRAHSAYLLLCHRRSALPPSPRTAHRHPLRLSFPVHDAASQITG